MKDIPYNTLMQNKRAYEIMLLRDQFDNTFTEIAKEYEISAQRVKQIYHNIKLKQIQLYINHISLALGHENVTQVKNVYDNAYECYHEWTYACAYLEKKYKGILNEYRNGEPGMPKQFLKSMPPFKSKLSKKIISRVIEMREDEKASYLTIGKELHMTQAKARHTYDGFYHEQVLELIKTLQEKAKCSEEKEDIWKYYFGCFKTSKKRYEALMKRMEKP